MSAIGNALNSLFLSPLFLWFLALIPPIILLYLLKLRRTPVVIASTLLWRKSLEDLTANAPFQKLRKNLLLFLQILIVLLVVIALARPYVQAEGVLGASMCILIDRSASMGTEEAGGTRMDEAKDRAFELLQDMRPGDEAMVVAFGHSAAVLCEMTDDLVRLRRAIRSVEPGETATNLRDALTVANSLRAQERDMRVVVISDGRVQHEEELSETLTDVSFLRVGETRDNAGIVGFSMRQAGGAAERQTFTLVHNESDAPLNTTLSLYFNDELLGLEEIEVAAGEQREALFAHPELGEGVLRAEIDVDDALAVDNRAWLALRPAAKLDVLLVAKGDSRGAYFLRRVLRLDPRTEISTVNPDAYAVSDAYDLTIFDGYAPQSLPGGASLFINAAPPIEGLRVTGVFDDPPVVATNAEHPVMRFLEPSNVRVREARRMEFPEWAAPLMSTSGGTLLADVSTGNKRVLVLTFDLADSSWPARLSFPLFIQNLLTWVPRSGLAEQSQTAAGRPISLLPDPEGVATEARVTAPDGSEETVPLDATRPVYYGGTEQTGVYAADYGRYEVPYAVNLLDLTESAIAPAETLRLGVREVAAEERRALQNRELWRYILLGALAVLCLEWWIYARRAWM